MAACMSAKAGKEESASSELPTNDLQNGERLGHKTIWKGGCG